MAVLTIANATGVCAATAPKVDPIAAYLADKPAPALPLFRSAFTEGERNMVLNLDRAGLASLELDEEAAAIAALDKSILRIEAVYAKNPNAEKARSKFVKEAIKDFKGEPYERVMVFYYRGLLYLRAGDYQNARAAFGEGQNQDAFAEDQLYESDYALLELLSGWSSHCDGDEDKANDFYARARKKRADIAIPKATDKVLLLADIGTAPQKWADGQYKEALHFRVGTFNEAGVSFVSSDNDLAIKSQARAAVDQRVAAEAAETTAQEAVKTKVAFATTARSMADTTAGDIASALRSVASGEVAATPTAPPPPAAAGAKGAAAAKRAASERGAAARAEVARLQAEKLAAEQAALNAAIAADQAETDAVAAQASVKTASAGTAKARAAEKTALATLPALGLALTQDFVADSKAVDTTILSAGEGDNLFWQASTRGGRPIDAILAGKASFKAGASEFGNTMTQGSLIALQTASTMAQQTQSLAAQGYSVNNNAANGAAVAGLAFLAVGLISQAVSAAANPAADIRYWDSLPGDLRFATTTSGATAYRAIFRDAQGRSLTAKPFNVKMDPSGRCGVGWVRSRSAINIPASAPNSEDPKR